MREVNLGALTVSAQGGPWALTLYQREFKESGKRYDWYSDYEEAFAEAEQALKENPKINDTEYLSKIEPLFLLRTLWACAKNANEESIPSFEEWIKSLEISMAPWAAWKWEVWLLIQAEIFRNPQIEAQAEVQEEKPDKRRTGRRKSTSGA